MNFKLYQRYKFLAFPTLPAVSLTLIIRSVKVALFLKRAKSLYKCLFAPNMLLKNVTIS